MLVTISHVGNMNNGHFGIISNQNDRLFSDALNNGHFGDGHFGQKNGHFRGKNNGHFDNHPSFWYNFQPK